jgi:hypothetical protein
MILNWLAMLIFGRPMRKKKTHASVVIFALMSVLASGCATKPTGGGWNGPLVDPEGNVILPPTYEAVR